MQEIKVYPNPFAALGPDGMPCGRLLVEPGHPRPYDVIGGRLIRQRIEHDDSVFRTPKEKALERRLDRRDPRIRVLAEVKMAPRAQRLTPWHRERVMSGDLIAADPATAKACGLLPKEFRAPLDVLRGEMRARIAEWTASHGEPPPLADYDLVQNGDEIALVQKDAAPEPKPKSNKGPAREAPPNVSPLP